MRRKAYAYITHKNRLLIFTQDPRRNAGTQVPGGTIEEGEDPDVGVMREAEEETGLKCLTRVALVGEKTWRGADGVDVAARFYHLTCDDPTPPECWDHWEITPSDGSSPVLFHLRWTPLNDVPNLAGDQGCMLATMHR